MPEILADWGWVGALMAAAGTLATMFRIRDRTDEHAEAISNLESFTTEFREWRAGFDQWKEDHLTEERTRSKRMDKITEGVSEMSKAFNKVAQEHEGRIGWLEGKANGSG